MSNIAIIGAGQIGSRHLQALKKVRIPLAITVVDPKALSLSVAKERYDSMENGTVSHKLIYKSDMEKMAKKFDVVIVATNSDVRRKVVEKLFKKSNVDYLVLEKLLFQKKEDYAFIDKLLTKHGTKAWVNCSMRTMPFYNSLKKEIKEESVQCVVTGSQYGLVTNAIHYIDHIAFLTDCYEYMVDTVLLDPKPIESKRKGFVELNGTLRVCFKDGSLGTFTCYRNGNAPVVIEIFSKNYRCISKETEQKVWISSPRDNWRWIEVNAKIPFQSKMTTEVVEQLLKKGNCALTSFNKSSKLHIILLEALRKFLNEKARDKFNYHPFT